MPFHKMLGGCYVFYFYFYFVLRSKIFSENIIRKTRPLTLWDSIQYPGVLQMAPEYRFRRDFPFGKFHSFTYHCLLCLFVQKALPFMFQDTCM